MTKRTLTTAIRRPQIQALARKLRRQSPKLSDREALTLAKIKAKAPGEGNQ